MRIFIRQNSFILALTIAFALLFSTCKKESNPITPPDSRPVLTPADYGNVTLTLSSYDTARVTHQLGIDLRSPNIISVGLGTKDSTGYIQSHSYTTTYDPSARAYIIHFDFTVRLDSSKAFVPLTIRYYFTDSTFTDADTTVLAYQYPYPTVEVVVPFSALKTLLGTHHLQDVDRIGSSVFFHPMGSLGLYVYDLNTRQITELFGYGGGDYIAAESVFVFCDVDHTQIRRFNSMLNAVDLTIPGTGIQYDGIRGMDAYGGHLYIHRDFSGLRKYTLDGVLVDSLDFQTSSYMTISDSIIYDVEFQPGRNNLRRYDMRTRSFLPKVFAPASSTEGIKAYSGKLYYCDFEKGIIGAVPISDLRTVQ